MRRRLPRRGAARLFLMAAVALSISKGIIPRVALAGSSLPGYSFHEVNGVKVYFRKPADEEEAQGAQIGAIMWADIGNQKQDEAHCAHMAEHMVLMYPGPRVRVLNGEAGLDHTTFAISVPHEDTLDLLSALLDSMFRCVVKPDETFKTEMKRARREVDVMQGGVAEVALLNKMRAAIFEGTKYHEAFFETPLTEVTAEKIRGFIEREYTPSRLALIVTADVEERELLSHIAQCLETGRGLAGRDTTDPEREGGEVPIERQGLRDIREAGTHLRSRLDTGRRAFRRLSRDGGFSLAESCPRS